IKITYVPPVLCAARIHGKVGTFQVHTEKLCSTRIFLCGLLVTSERVEQSLFITRERCGHHRRGAVLHMLLRNLQECLLASVHEIMSSTTMNVNVDKSRRHVLSLRVYFNRIRHADVAFFY